jgi:hypothetical protein
MTTITSYPAGWEREHADTLGVICHHNEHPEDYGDRARVDDRHAIDAGGIAICLDAQGYDARMRFLGRVLNKLRHWGYVRRLKTGYVPTDAGTALL